MYVACSGMSAVPLIRKIAVMMISVLSPLEAFGSEPFQVLARSLEVI
jgi:hypothetical protein